MERGHDLGLIETRSRVAALFYNLNNRDNTLSISVEFLIMPLQELFARRLGCHLVC